MSIKDDSNKIIRSAIAAALPNTAVEKALQGECLGEGKIVLIAIGKASWQMSKTACDILGEKISHGVIITKYLHNNGDIPNLKIFEAGHPVPDNNTFIATKSALSAVQDLTVNDTVLFLVSGGGSSLFESPLIDPHELATITKDLLSSGADIVEINTVRKRLSAVKGGKFAKLCSPANVFSIVLSDIIGDPLDMIASGPAYPDSSTCEDALSIIKKYSLELSPHAMDMILTETPKFLNNVTTRVTGSVKQLCRSAEETCRELGYSPITLTSSLCCTAKDAGSFLGSIAAEHQDSNISLAFIAGGETVVNLIGKGKGGRNQELVLSAAQMIAGFDRTAIFSVGSDGTDGPTDAAGGYCDGNTKYLLDKMDMSIFAYLKNNDSYNALKMCDGLVITGPTGTNVNDLSVLLIRR